MKGHTIPALRAISGGAAWWWHIPSSHICTEPTSTEDWHLARVRQCPIFNEDEI